MFLQLPINIGNWSNSDFFIFCRTVMAADQRSDIKKQCFCENRCPVSLNRRKIAGNSRLKGAPWSKFDEFAKEFAAIRAA
jgi:hypothetical protein